MRAVKTIARAALAMAVFAMFLSEAVFAEASKERIAEVRAEMKALGLKYDSAWELYQALVEQADGGEPLRRENIPGWRGVYTRTKGGTTFDPDGPPQGEVPTTANFTPEFHKKLLQAVEDRKNDIEYDPLSQCIPPGYPRWLDLPFLREFIVTPYQTTMIAEAFNSVRRIYTDGRDHIPEEDRYPTQNGDSIGIWDGDRLVTHTNQLMAGMYERAQGFYTNQVEGVEIWEKIDDTTLVAHVWIYDPPALEEPWYTRQSYTKLANPDKSLRIRHWACKGNPNNNVVETREGGSQFTEFTWMDEDDKNGDKSDD